MTFDKDIRFTDKRVDESYKNQAARDKGAHEPQESKSEKKQVQTSKPFVNLITSLGVQALMHLGEIPNPATQETEVNTDAAREMIDLISEIKNKTEGNRSAEENQLLDSLLPELQMKFSQKV